MVWPWLIAGAIGLGIVLLGLLWAAEWLISDSSDPDDWECD